MTTIATIAAGVERMIEAIAPDLRPDIPFRLAPYNGLLHTLPLPMGSDGTRLFHVLVGPDTGGGPRGTQWAGGTDMQVRLEEPLIIQVRYALPVTDGRWREAMHVRATDQDRIIHQLARSDGGALPWGADGRPISLKPQGTPQTTAASGPAQRSSDAPDEHGAVVVSHIFLIQHDVRNSA